MVAQPALGAATAAGVVAQRPGLAALPLVPAFEYANFWRRAGAMLIDTAIFGIPYLVVIFVFGALAGLLAGGTEAETLSSVLAIGNCLMQILGLAVFWLYYALMESSPWQATLGKRALSIIVTDLDGNRVSFGRATGRYWAKLLSGLLMGIGYLMALFTEKKQAMHDSLAGCLVISGKATATSREPVEEIPAPAAAMPAVVPSVETPEPAAVPTVVPSVEIPEPVDVLTAAPATPEPPRRTGEGKLGF
ncbi:MAG: RDD family protein [Chloroflexi bacterium]|nr:RDD family protein [Chloroflexota bacterium]